MAAWEDKAHDTVARLCHASWVANERQAGYSVPHVAAALVTALGLVDPVEREFEVRVLLAAERGI